MIRRGLWTRLRIRASGEIPRDELLVYRHASLEVWALVEAVAERRRIGDVLPLENLAAWIVFCFQTTGNALMDADVHADPATADFIPIVTHGEVLKFYREIGPWLARAADARARPASRVRRRRPAAYPTMHPGLQAHIVGVNALLVSVRAMSDELPHVAPGLPRESAVASQIEAALAIARYALELAPPGPRLTQPDLDRLGPALRKAAIALFRAGQVAALPSLLAPPKPD